MAAGGPEDAPACGRQVELEKPLPGSIPLGERFTDGRADFHWVRGLV